MEEIRNRIIEKSLDQFMRLGIRSVSMDNIASNLGMSKKTLYQYFSDKDDLVDAAVEFDLGRDKEDCICISKSSTNAVEEVMKILEAVTIQLKDMNPMLLHDLSKFHHKAYGRFQTYKNEFIVSMISANLQRGIREGLYREDIHIPILSKFRIESMMMIFNTELFPRNASYDTTQIIKVLGEHFLYGIATPKGYKKIQKIFSTYKIDL